VTHFLALLGILTGLAVGAFTLQPVMHGTDDLILAVGNVVSHTTIVSPTEYHLQVCDPYKCSLVIIDQHGVDEFRWSPTDSWSEPS
jgi:hypothetical protein